eukprot:TRINITY_DN872_c2_g1_i1.p3 TRINITY_DN872_c2_g1~~TRINITY_DN872_c2_g1_i1.p3  ORF type:complete len:109 (+),score=0.41 TRINITY_DN872_c2_g1_i1:2274-2600(+)
MCELFGSINLEYHLGRSINYLDIFINSVPLRGSFSLFKLLEHTDIGLLNFFLKPTPFFTKSAINYEASFIGVAAIKSVFFGFFENLRFLFVNLLKVLNFFDIKFNLFW